MKDFRFHLNYILESIQTLKKYMDGVSCEQFKTSVQLQDAAIRRLEIIGEAAKKTPTNFREQYDNIPWRKMAAMRDVLAHDYISLRMDAIWQTITNDILPLEPDVKEVIRKEL